MQTSAQQWGDEITLRILQLFAEAAKIGVGSRVELTYTNGKLVITLIRGRKRLAELLTAITKTNRHREIKYGVSSGREEW
ncbi:MAG: AbrB/MazE/SpoVT family DNA-binding domain-containing protein [Armatimonadetes bacterium]|nr:AbrB/MazE/SpoVT family DNA-binding domain-containing protein [Armatimonadota bacterium]